MEWAEKIRCIENELGITGERGLLARLLRIRPGRISEIKSGKTKTPSADIPLLMITLLGINPDWLNRDEPPIFTNKDWLKKQPHYLEVFGERLKKQPNDAKPFCTNGLKKQPNSPLPDTPAGGTMETRHRGIPLVFESDKEFEDGIVIPVLGDNPVSAGHGEGIGDGEFPTRYIHAPKELAKYPHLMSLPVRGDSMTPTLSDGDMVVCDGGGWDGDGIYVIKTIDETFVKRVQHMPQGYRIVSDNKLYESYTAAAEEIAIVGRVRAMVVMVPGRRGGV